MSTTVLVVDDDRANLDSVCRTFQREGVDTLAATSGNEAIEYLRKPEVGVVVTDVMMPGIDGQALLKAARAMRPDVEVVLMTAYGSVETAVSAMRDGAYDFITKPLKRHSLLNAVQKALEKRQLVAENRDLKAQIAAMGSTSMIGQSPAFRAFVDLLKQAGPSTATVLLLGESGTGKELAAKSLHELSTRQKETFVALNCTALPETLLEGELFGVEKGAFTGAVARKEGRFERANKGTLFLDEIGEMTLAAQAKLLRVLQEGEVERLGGTHTIKVDVRVIAATNRDLSREVEEGRFRRDLYYRLNVVEVRVPSLAERREDIPLLVEHFVKRFSVQNKKTMKGVSDNARAVLENYAWPGNIRELEHAMQRAVVLCKSDTIDVSDLPESISKGPTAIAGQVVIPIGTPMDEVERRMIEETLKHTKGDKNLAARMLGIASRTIYRRLATNDADVQKSDE